MIVLIAFIAILTSSLTLGIFNTVRFLIANPDLENLRDTATNLINTSNFWNLLNEILRGVLIIFLIKFINRKFNKSKISLIELGLHFNFKQLAYIISGIVLMSSIFLFSLFIDAGNQTVSDNLSITLSQNSIIMLILIAFANAFWQEIVFRGYFQKRLINSYGILAGILLTSFLFTIIHGLARDINLTEIILGTVLFTLIGIVYYLTNSIVFVTAIHAAGNFLLRSFGNNELYIPGQEYRLMIFGIILILIMFIFRKTLFLQIKQLAE
ncbi:MAG: hypothetical protein B6I20_07305 [Bacteroidetes bacterium 4572_117]|nr:MAG: hypothetical protein B6I20_07305 [Bacteroidetes bacterium 4572_117]